MLTLLRCVSARPLRGTETSCQSAADANPAGGRAPAPRQARLGCLHKLFADGSSETPVSRRQERNAIGAAKRARTTAGNQGATLVGRSPGGAQPIQANVR